MNVYNTRDKSQLYERMERESVMISFITRAIFPSIPKSTTTTPRPVYSHFSLHNSLHYELTRMLPRKSITDCLFGWNWRKTLWSSLAEPWAIRVEAFSRGQAPFFEAFATKIHPPEGVAGWWTGETSAKKPLLRFDVCLACLSTRMVRAFSNVDSFVRVYAR